MEDLDTIDAVEDPILPSEQVLINLIAQGVSLPDAALQAFPFKEDPVAFANFRLKKRELYRAAVIAYGDSKFSDFRMVDTYADILTHEDSDSFTKLKALKDYHTFKQDFTHDPKSATVSIDVDVAATVNTQIIKQFFENPSPSDIMPPVLIPKEHIYDVRQNESHGQDTRQRDTQEREGDVRISSKADPK